MGMTTTFVYLSTATSNISITIVKINTVIINNLIIN